MTNRREFLRLSAAASCGRLLNAPIRKRRSRVGQRCPASSRASPAPTFPKARFRHQEILSRG